ncbi:hypothetical protein EJ04DRAFT_510094 [Polyplosphaeria fusca]|uniref:Uncharacterized protein n=1 Tax=Polyplosphaeria fusca TaxID=682080 RepID=A0A9P4R623_9PLEO|nr:hypothetical protein EJ04DRAFT_510094 [Polyplosphaeria fusca]
MSQSQTEPDEPFLPFGTAPPIEDKPAFIPRSYPHERLGLPFDQRLLAGLFFSFSSGFIIGSWHAGHAASLRFRAENAHRLPVSSAGWYLYHKSKNYYKWKHGITTGLRKGGFVATWATMFFTVEESLDVFRGTWRAGRTLYEMEGVDELEMAELDASVTRSRDFWSSAIAGMATGGLWSAWNAFPMQTAARTIRMGLLVGLGYGWGQDAIKYVRRRWVPEVGPEERWIYQNARVPLKKKQEDELEVDGSKG